MLELQVTDLPVISAVRPAFCPHCGAIAGAPGHLNLWGHGSRSRAVIVPGARAVRAWVRRFWCRCCGATCSVSAAEVLSRFRYTLAAIVTAWFLAAPRPIGDGLDEATVYAHTGVDRRVPGPDPDRAGNPRWRSLARWAARMPTWWPARPVVGATWRERATALVAGFIPGEGERDGAVRRALAAHTAGGRAM
jgi:hypothetical protein